MTDPCLWCWEIHDTLSGHVVGSSWSDDWMAYDSPREAVLAATRRVTAMKREENVLRLKDIDWSDLGEPQRVMATLARIEAECGLTGVKEWAYEPRRLEVTT